jgi:NAD(P)-dependent dehydrogenase (short-subunit alcohol dehydrogenase family)
MGRESEGLNVAGSENIRRETSGGQGRAGGPVVLITGATSGIGQATARLLAAHGYRVIGTSRRPPAPEVDGYELLPLEVTSDESVAACVAGVAARTGGRIDVLMNNVGTGILGAAEESSAGQVQRLFDVNVLGMVRMTNAVLPYMRAQRAGRILVMSSLAGEAAVPFAPYYVATKQALEGYTQALRQELKPLGIAATIVAPGLVGTPAGDTAMRGDRPIEAYQPARGRAVDGYAWAIRHGMDPQRVAQAILRILQTPRPRARYTVGAQSVTVSLLRRVLPPEVFPAAMRRLLWR